MYLLFTACVAKPTQVVSLVPAKTETLALPSTPTKISTLTKTPIPPTSTSTVSKTPTPSKTANLPTPTIVFYEPQVIKVCPDQQETTFEKLDLDPSYRLIVDRIGGAQGSAVMMLSASEPITQEVPNAKSKEGKILYWYGPSPSDEWLIIGYRDEGETQVSIWYSSLDGEKQWEVATLDTRALPRFISDEELTVIGVPADKQYLGRWPWEEYTPLESINPFTGESKELPVFLPRKGIFDFYFSHEGRAYAVYYLDGGPFEDYYLYDYEEATSSPVFQWLLNIEGWHYLNPGIVVRDNDLFTITLDRSYGFDMAFDLSFDKIFQQKSYNEIMKAVVLPGGDSIDITTLVFKEVTGESFPVYRTGSENYKPRPLYMFDYKNLILKDYCLESALDEVISGRISISKDGRLLSTTLYDVTEGVVQDLVPKAVLVLDTETGHFSRILGFESIGWAIDESKP